MIWVRADRANDPDSRKEMVTASLENNFMDIVILEEDRGRFEKLGKFDPMTIQGSQLKYGRLIGSFMEMNDEDGENEIEDLRGNTDIIVICSKNWKVIPVENLIASFHGSGTKLVAEVRNLSEAKLLLETLEIGVDGILLDLEDPGDLIKVRKMADDLEMGHADLVPAEVTSIKPLGTGDRVCIDTCSILEIGEGMLVGSQSSGLFLVHSESVDSEYIDTRPFRVNAGPVHSYVLTPDDRTRYLSDLAVGEEVMVVDRNGNTRSVIIGRIKIERRPLVLIEAKYLERTHNIILQNAETIRLISNDEPVSIVDLKIGDRILMNIGEGGRHFGMRIEETIIEK